MNIKLSLQKLNDLQIPYSWLTIFAGKKLNIITDQEISNYAADQLEHADDNSKKLLLNLAKYLDDPTIDPTNFENDFKKSLHYLYPSIDITKELEHETKKWRYLFLKELAEANLENEKLFEALDNIYVLFNGPSDMANLVSYIPYNMPAKQAYTEKECHEYRSKNLVNFLEKEKKILSSLSK